jgi:hypothetical protein
VPNGFQREPVKRKMSADRRRLDYTFVDKQIPVPLPDNMTFAELHHRVSSLNASGSGGSVINFTRWRHTLTGTLEPKATVRKDEAWTLFMFFAATRIYRALLPSLNGGKAATWIPQHLEFDENVLGLDSSFVYQYDVVLGDLSFLLKNSGLWQPVAIPDASGRPTGEAWSFDSWRRSLENDATASRGILRLRYLPRADTLLDLCTNAPDAEPSEGVGDVPTPPPPPGNELNPSPVGVPKLGPGSTSFPTSDLAFLFPSSNPDPISSILEYDVEITYQEKDNLVEHRPLAGNIIKTPATMDPTNLLAVLQSDGTDPARVASNKPNILQRMTAPSAMVRVSGRIMRLGIRITPPRLVSFQGIDLTDKHSQVITEKVVTRIGDIPVFGLLFSITYRLPTTKNGPLPLLSNPGALTPGTQGATLASPIQSPGG